jgi:hypothetical protein
MYLLSLRWDKGLGNAAISGRMLYGAGYWDFANEQESAVDNANTRVYLSELATSSATLSWYKAEITLPPTELTLAIEILDSAVGEADNIIGDDLVTGGVSAASGGAGSISGGITRESFAVKVLTVLGVYDRSGIEADDQQNVLDAYDAVYQELKDDGLVTWSQGDGELIPVRFMNSLVAIVAATDVLIGAYPQQPNRAQAIALGAAMGQRRIRKQLASAQDTETTTVEYF